MEVKFRKEKDYDNLYLMSYGPDAGHANDPGHGDNAGDNAGEGGDKTAGGNTGQANNINRGGLGGHVDNAGLYGGDVDAAWGAMASGEHGKMMQALAQVAAAKKQGVEKAALVDHLAVPGMSQQDFEQFSNIMRNYPDQFDRLTELLDTKKEGDFALARVITEFMGRRPDQFTELLSNSPEGVVGIQDLKEAIGTLVADELITPEKEAQLKALGLKDLTLNIGPEEIQAVFPGIDKSAWDAINTFVKDLNATSIQMSTASTTDSFDPGTTPIGIPIETLSEENKEAIKELGLTLHTGEDNENAYTVSLTPEEPDVGTTEEAVFGGEGDHGGAELADEPYFEDEPVITQPEEEQPERGPHPDHGGRQPSEPAEPVLGPQEPVITQPEQQGPEQTILQQALGGDTEAAARVQAAQEQGGSTVTGRTGRQRRRAAVRRTHHLGRFDRLNEPGFL